MNAAADALEFRDAPFAFVGDSAPADLSPYAGQLVLIDDEIFKVVPHPHSAHDAQMNFRDPVNTDIASSGVNYRGTFANYLSVPAPAEDDVIYARDVGRLYKRVGAYWRWLQVPRFITDPPVNDEAEARVAVVASSLTPKNGLLVAWSGSDLRAVENYVAPTSPSVSYDLETVSLTADQIRNLISTYGNKAFHGTTVPANTLGVVGDLYLRHVTQSGTVTSVEAHFKTGATTWTRAFTFPVGSTASGINAATAQGIVVSEVKDFIESGTQTGIDVTFNDGGAGNSSIDFAVDLPLPDGTADQIGYYPAFRFAGGAKQLLSASQRSRPVQRDRGIAACHPLDIYDHHRRASAGEIIFANSQWYKGGRQGNRRSCDGHA